MSIHSCGSLAFSSPEIIRKEPHCLKTDVWSLGICLYIITTGRLPFVQKSSEATKMNIIGRPIRF
jgi:serine/threonine protein kinase